MQFLSWDFSADLSTARNAETGEEVHFTRAEHALLQTMSSRRGRIFSRDLLLDAVSGLDSEASDRSIDFLINRLRRKLHDPARESKFIQTRYGEGYVWIAKAAPVPACSSGAFIAVGPVHNLESAGDLEVAGHRFARCLAEALDHETTPANRVLLQENNDPGEAAHGEPPQFGVSLHFLRLSETRLECAVMLRRCVTGAILTVSRICVCDNTVKSGQDPNVAQSVAQGLLDQIWQELNFIDKRNPVPNEVPVPVRLHSSTETVTGDPETWEDAERRLRAVLREDPQNPEAQLRLAAALHSKYILFGHVLLRTRDPRRRDEAEIERLVTAAVPHLRDNAVLMLTAAKLLYFVNAAYRRLAVEISEDAIKTTTALAVACAIVAQLRAWTGRIKAAIDLYDQALALNIENIHFILYLRILKCEALLASGDFAAATDEATRMYKTAPHTRSLMCLFLDATEEVDLEPHIHRMMNRLGERGAWALLLSHHYISSRLFEQPLHRQNTLRRPVALLTRYYGPRCIPKEILADIPADLLPN